MRKGLVKRTKGDCILINFAFFYYFQGKKKSEQWRQQEQTQQKKGIKKKKEGRKERKVAKKKNRRRRSIYYKEKVSPAKCNTLLPPKREQWWLAGCELSEKGIFCIGINGPRVFEERKETPSSSSPPPTKSWCWPGWILLLFITSIQHIRSAVCFAPSRIWWNALLSFILRDD